MATKSPTQTHNQWPNVSDPTELPNVSGATIQDAAVQVGDQCYSVSDTSTYTCTTATVGSGVWSSPGGGADADAIHDNVSAEISAVAPKATPTTSDYLLIEDENDSDAKKSITIGDLPAATPAFHASSHNSGGGDALAIDASAGTGSLRTIGTGSLTACAGDDSRLSDGRTDSNAIHVNVLAEISGLTPKAAPVAGDYLVIEDSEASDAKKSITIADLPGGAPSAHDLGGSSHNADTLADLNTKVSDATLDDVDDPRNADQLQGTDIDASLAPSDGQVLTYDGAGTQWTAASPAEGSSYLEMGTNHTITSAGGSPDTEDVGRGVFDASRHNTVSVRAVVSSVYATTGSVSVKLYDDGSPSTPDTPRLVTTFTHTDDTLTYEAFEQALTVVSSSPSTNEILGVERVYRAVVEITATSGDTATVSTVGLVAVGNGSVVTLNADMIQAIAMSLNA